MVPNAYFEMAISQNRAQIDPVFFTEFYCKHNEEQNMLLVKSEIRHYFIRLTISYFRYHFGYLKSFQICYDALPKNGPRWNDNDNNIIIIARPCLLKHGSAIADDHIQVYNLGVTSSLFQINLSVHQ